MRARSQASAWGREARGIAWAVSLLGGMALNWSTPDRIRPVPFITRGTARQWSSFMFGDRENEELAMEMCPHCGNFKGSDGPPGLSVTDVGVILKKNDAYLAENDSVIDGLRDELEAKDAELAQVKDDLIAALLELSEVKAERDCFKGCCTRAFDKWLELYPEVEPRPDGAVQIVEIMRTLEQRVRDLEALPRGYHRGDRV